jgi:hypothetical protein
MFPESYNREAGKTTSGTGGGNTEAAKHRLSAMLPRTDRNPFAVERRAYILRLVSAEHKRNYAGLLRAVPMSRSPGISFNTRVAQVSSSCSYCAIGSMPILLR